MSESLSGTQRSPLRRTPSASAARAAVAEAEAIAARAAADVAAEAADSARTAVDVASAVAARAAARASDVAAAAATAGTAPGTRDTDPARDESRRLAARDAAVAAASTVAAAVTAAAALVAAAARQAAALLEGQLTLDGAAAAPAVHHVAGTSAPAPDANPAHASAVPADRQLPRYCFDPADPDAVAGFAGTAERSLWRDISLAQRLSVALRESEGRFEEVFDRAPAPMLVAALPPGRPARFVHVNRALVGLTGFSAAHLMDLGFADLARPALAPDTHPGTHGDSHPETRPDGSGAGDPLRRWIRADGRAIWVRLRLTRLGAAEHELVLAQVEDVSAQLSALARADERSARFGSAFALAPVPALVVELGEGRLGRLSAANPAACRLLGRDQVEMPWTVLDRLLAPAERPALRALLSDLASGRRRQAASEHCFRDATDRPATLRLSAHAEPGADGRPAYALVHLTRR